MKKVLYVKNSIFFLLTFLSLGILAQDLHVAKDGDDTNPGTAIAPFKTISYAASKAEPGNTVIIHEGTYREYIDPPRGGDSETSRIVYKAAAGEEVFVKGSEEITNWELVEGSTYKTTIPVADFNGYNPYTLNVSGDFQVYGQWHTRGDVYVNNSALPELRNLTQVKEVPNTWVTSTEGDTTTIYANFGTVDPNATENLVEINFRELLFFSRTIGVDYITVEGIRFLHAAPNWQAPNTGDTDAGRLTQVGAVGCHYGSNWIIRNCEVSYSRTAGIVMGESITATNSTVEGSPEAYPFGKHLIENNVITKCGEYGIAGQKGMSGSKIIGNRIEDINYRNEFGGIETSGIKVWNTVDVLIENNYVGEVIYTPGGNAAAVNIWIDFACQNTRITRNILKGSSQGLTALYIEANVGQTLIDNNVIISAAGKNILNYSGGSVYAHNLFVDTGFDIRKQNFDNGPTNEGRLIYLLKPHTMEVTQSGIPVKPDNNKFYNNIFAGAAGLGSFSKLNGDGNVVDGNLYIDGTSANINHDNAKESSYDLLSSLTEITNGFEFSYTIDNSFEGIATTLVDADRVGAIPITGGRIQTIEGVDVSVNQDFNLVTRMAVPQVGPLASMVAGDNTVAITTTKEAISAIQFLPPPTITPPPPGTQEPYEGITRKLMNGFVLEAEEFDEGNNEDAYSTKNRSEDPKPGRSGFRTDSDVQIFGAAAGYLIGYFDGGDWLEYTLDVEPGIYTITVTAAPGPNPNNLSFSFEDAAAFANVAINKTEEGDYNVLGESVSNNVSITGGTAKILRITSGGGFNFDKVVFEKTGTLSTSSFENIGASLFPNPVSNMLTIQTEDNHIPDVKIYTMTGQLILSDFSKTIAVNSLSKGLYLIEIDGKAIKKFIKD